MPDQHHLIADGVSLSIRSWPAELERRRPVVLLAGTGLTAQDWDTVAADLSRDRVVHAVDLRGHGLSAWPGDYSIDAMARDVTALLPQLGPPVDVIGHSLGGLVACITAADSNAIRRLILEDVGLLHPRQAAEPSRPDGDLDFDWAMMEQVRPEIDNPSPAWPQILSKVTVPTLAISGGSTSFVAPEQVREFTELVADGTFVTIDAGHLVHESRPEEFLRAARGHLDAPAPPDRP